jgi:hypothetical protein
MQRPCRGLSAALLVVLAGCGGGGDGEPEPSPVPASVTVSAGNAQSARYGTAVAVSPAVTVRDASGAAVPGVDVTFSPTGGGGTVTGATARTTASGVATVGGWTLGPTPGANALRASVGSLTTTVSATATTGPASSVTVQAGNAQVVAAGAIVPVAPSVLVTDGTYHVPDVDVTFSVTAGGGTVTPAVVRSSAAGLAQVGSWQLGAAGPQSLTATVPGAAPVTITATALAAGGVSLNKAGGDATVAIAGNFTPSLPVVEVRNGAGQPAAGVSVEFAVSGGGGTASRTTVTTGAGGRASPGTWRFGTAGPQSLSATTANAPPVTFTGTATAAPASQFNIEVVFLDPQPTDAQKTAFLAARDRWQAVIVGDLADVATSIPANTCGAGGPQISGPIDDVVILAAIRGIDGPGQVLARAGPCLTRLSGRLTYAGLVEFDLDDIDFLGSLGSGLSDVAFHEFGHVLGFGTLWSDLGVIISPNSNAVAFTGAAGRQAYTAALSPGSTTPSNADVPVENCVGIPGCGEGTRDGHWREPVFTNEIMTGFYNSGGVNPFSAVSASSMRDLGYVVNDAVSGGFILPLVLGGFRSGAGTVATFRELLAPWPILVVDERGSVREEARR